MSDGPMNHLECREELGAVIDGAAGQSERTAVSAHLAACAQCRAYEHKLRSLWGILAKEAKLSANFDQRFLAQLAQQRPNRLRDVVRAKWWRHFSRVFRRGSRSARNWPPWRLERRTAVHRR